LPLGGGLGSGLQPLHLLRRQRDLLNVAVVVRHGVLIRARVVFGHDAGEPLVLLGPEDFHATVHRLRAGVLERDVVHRARRIASDGKPRRSIARSPVRGRLGVLRLPGLPLLVRSRRPLNLRAPPLRAASFDDSLRGAQPSLAHGARSRDGPSPGLRIVALGVHDELQHGHDAAQGEVIEGTRPPRLPPGVPRRPLGLLRRLVILRRGARAGSAAAAAPLTPRDVDAHLVEPDPDLHLLPPRAHHRARVAPVFALLHAAVPLERGGGEDDAVALARLGGAVLQIRSAHAPEHGAPRQVHAVDPAAHGGHGGGWLTPRPRRRHRPRLAVRPAARLVFVLVLLRHLLRGVPADGPARQVLAYPGFLLRHQVNARALLVFTSPPLRLLLGVGKLGRRRRGPPTAPPLVRFLRGAVGGAVGAFGRGIPVDLRALRARLRLFPLLLRDPRDSIPIRRPLTRPLARKRVPLLRRDVRVEVAHPPISRSDGGRHAPRHPAPLPAPGGFATNARLRIKPGRGRLPLGLDPARRPLLPFRRPLPRILLRGTWGRVRRETRGDARLPPLRRQPRFLSLAVLPVELLLPLALAGLDRRA